jgi:CO dehydrogenase maturation factor
MKIAVSGKGGVGKTLIAGGLAKGFVERGLKTIAIDADSSPNLGLTLGLSTEETRKITPISENQPLLESKTSTGYSGVYNLNFSVDDIVKQYSVPTPLGVNLIVMGTVHYGGRLHGNPNHRHPRIVETPCLNATKQVLDLGAWRNTLDAAPQREMH